MRYLAFLLLISACTNFPATPDSPQCSPVMKILHGTDYISIKESYCLCRVYHFGVDYVGPVPGLEAYREPIESCNKLIGWTPEEYAKKANFWEEVRKEIKKRLKK